MTSSRETGSLMGLREQSLQQHQAHTFSHAHDEEEEQSTESEECDLGELGEGHMQEDTIVCADHHDKNVRWSYS